MRHYARRADSNQKEIAEALRRTGAIVVLTHAVGGGFPDLVCARGGVTYLLEIKREKRASNESNRRTIEAQRLFRERWRGGPLHVVRSVSEAFDVVVHGLAPKGDPRNESQDRGEQGAGE